MFDDYAKESKLKISVKKYMIYLADLNDHSSLYITYRFPFSTRQLLVKYMGLPLYYEPLLEKIGG